MKPPANKEGWYNLRIVLWLRDNWFRLGVLLALFIAAVGVWFLYDEEPGVAASPTIIQVVSSTSTQRAFTGYDLPAIIGEWHPRMVQVECSFTGPTGDVFTQSGSGFLKASGVTVTAYTNRHILLDDAGSLAEGCTVFLPTSATSHFIDPRATSSVRIAEAFDWAAFTIANPIKEFREAAGGEFLECAAKATLGAPVIVLGYPSIGAIGDVTVTQGIIAGYDDEYYITDAKISNGNSGGMTVLVRSNPKESCFLGIPTFAEVGEVEALGRILDKQRIDLK